MKVRDTSPGRLYALSSEIGCVAINGAMAVDIPAGGQVVVLALDKKIVIDGDDAAKFVEVRWGTNTVVGSRPVPSWLSDVLSGLISIVGDANFDINYIPAENKLYLQFSLEVTTEQIEEVENLLGRELPKDLVTEMEWADGLPMSYTRLAYLESTARQYINTKVIPETATCVHCEFMTVPASSFCYVYGQQSENGIYDIVVKDQIKVRCSTLGNTGLFTAWRTLFEDHKYSVKSTVDELFIDGVKVATRVPGEYYYATLPIFLFTANAEGKPFGYLASKIYSFSLQRENKLDIELIPVLDDTGTPCMFDTVTRTPFRNDGTGDFIIGIETQQQLDNMLNSFPNYTGQAIEKLQINLAEALQTPENEARLAEAMVQNSTMPAMLSLDGEFVAPKFYAKLTEHGIRRLYHVPKGYVGTMDEYAAINGFKELVEPPMPLEGYWIPEWRETDTQLILDWVETEPPTEEELQIEDTENA